MNVLAPGRIERIVNGQWMQAPSPGRVATSVLIDSRDDLTEGAFIAIRGERHDGHTFIADVARAGAAFAVVEDRIDVTALPNGFGVLRVESTRACLGQLAASHRRELKNTTVIGITGSAGKTTTRTLIAGLLASIAPTHAAIRSFNNEIGLPLTILGATPDHRFLVLEIGTNAPGEVASLAAIARPDIGVITSIGHAHLEKLGDLNAVAREKFSMLHFVEPGGMCVVPAAHENAINDGAPAATVTRFGDGPNTDCRLTARGTHGDRQWFELDSAARFETALHGEHNAMNALVAILVARAAGVPDEGIQRVLPTIAPPSMRFEEVEQGNVLFVNDAYNANPDSMRASIRTFLERTADHAHTRTLVLGDMLELGGHAQRLHTDLGRFVASLVTRAPGVRVIWVGRHGEDISRGIAEENENVTIEIVPDADDASLQRIASTLAPGAAVLLKGSRRLRLERLIECAAGAGETVGS